ncbi:MAG: hypothetical protein AVDCRST_MAG34-2325, partial [uncultured Nocardioidaceae bacterium]
GRAGQFVLAAEDGRSDAVRSVLVVRGDPRPSQQVRRGPPALL